MNSFVVIDCETTGLGRHDRIVEIAALTLDPKTWEPVDEYDTLINPERDLGPVGLHGITASMVEAAPVFSEVAAALARRIHNAILVAHNLPFDSRMLAYEFARLGVPFDVGSGLCTYGATGEKLSVACDRLRITLDIQHCTASASPLNSDGVVVLDGAKTAISAATEKTMRLRMRPTPSFLSCVVG